MNDVNERSQASVQSQILLSEFGELILPSDLGTSGSELTAEAEGTRILSGSREGGGAGAMPPPKAPGNSTKLTFFLI